MLFFYAGYSAQGYAIYKMDDDSTFEKTPAFHHDQLQSINYPTAHHQQREYSALSNMSPRWWFPTLAFSEQRAQLGLTTAGNDALGIHNYSVSASYDIKLNEPAGELFYAYADRLFLSAIRLNEIYLDVNGELNRISKRSIASAVLAFPNYYVQRQTNVLFNVSYDNTSDEEIAAGAVPKSDFEDNLLGIGFLYNSANLNPLSISLIDGMRLRLVAEDSDTLSSDYSGQVYTLDWRQYIRTGKESVFALRFMQGWGTEQPRQFKLGGEGLNESAVSVLFGASLEPVFNVRRYALRGYPEGLPQLRGRRAQLLSGEWRFPLQRIEDGIMAPPIGIMQWFGTVFAETGSAYEDKPDKYYSSAGIEILADVNLFYYIILRARLGYAHGFDSDLGEDRLYIKIGSSF